MICWCSTLYCPSNQGSTSLSDQGTGKMLHWVLRHHASFPFVKPRFLCFSHTCPFFNRLLENEDISDQFWAARDGLGFRTQFNPLPHTFPPPPGIAFHLPSIPLRRTEANLGASLCLYIFSQRGQCWLMQDTLSSKSLPSPCWSREQPPQ